MAVSQKKVLHYELEEGNIEAEGFKSSMKKLIKKIPKAELKTKVFLMINAKPHVSNNTKGMLREEDVKILYNALYLLSIQYGRVYI